METRHDLEHTTERLTEGLRCPWKWGHWRGRLWLHFNKDDMFWDFELLDQKRLFMNNVFANCQYSISVQI